MGDVNVRVYVQVNDHALYPVGTADGESVDEVNAALAALFRSLSSTADTGAAFLETIIRYDEDEDCT